MAPRRMDGQKASRRTLQEDDAGQIMCEDPYRLKGMKDEKQPAVMWESELDEGGGCPGRLGQNLDALVRMPVFKASSLPGPAQTQ